MRSQDSKQGKKSEKPRPNPSLDFRGGPLGSALVSLILAVLVSFAFARVLGSGFVSYDDGDYVYGNPVVVRGLSFTGIRWAFSHFHAANWHPLTTLSHMLDCQLYGLQPSGHHLT